MNPGEFHSLNMVIYLEYLSNGKGIRGNKNRQGFGNSIRQII